MKVINVVMITSIEYIQSTIWALHNGAKGINTVMQLVHRSTFCNLCLC